MQALRREEGEAEGSATSLKLSPNRYTLLSTYLKEENDNMPVS